MILHSCFFVADDLSASLKSGDPFFQLLILFSELIRLNVFSYSSYLSTLIAKGEVKSPIVPYLPFVKDGEGEEGRKRPLHDTEPLSLSISIPALKKARTENNDSMEGASSGISSPGGSSNFGGMTSLESFILAPNHSDSPLMFPQDDQGVDENPALLQERAQKLQMLAATTDQYESLPLVSPLTSFNSPPHDNDAGGSPLSQTKVDPFSLSFFQEEEQNIDVSMNKHSLRHLIFATYFPICDSHLTKQEMNKRAVVLCGVGRMRQKVEAIIRKVTEEVEHNFRLLESIQSNILPETKLLPKFSSLPTFEQHIIATSCEKILRSSLSPVGGGGPTARTYPYPACAQLVFVCELLKLCGSVHQIIELLVDIVECTASLSQEEGHRNPGKSFPPLPSELCLDVIGLLQKYLPCLLLSQQNTTIIFEG